MAEKTIIFYAARHGETELNAKNRFRGHNDVPLDANGRRQAAALAFYFQPIELSHIIASDKRRAMETAKTIADSKSMSVWSTPNLHPWDVGVFSGQPKNAENKAKLECYIQNPDEPIPGGEALNEFKSRVRPCFKEAIEIADRCGEPVLLVMHSSDIHEIGAMFCDSHLATLVEPGGVVAVYVEDGRLGAEPIFRGRTASGPRRADTVS